MRRNKMYNDNYIGNDCNNNNNNNKNQFGLSLPNIKSNDKSDYQKR